MTRLWNGVLTSPFKPNANEKLESNQQPLTVKQLEKGGRHSVLRHKV